MWIPHGSICALVTPFLANGEIDLESFSGLLEWHIECGTDAVVVAGSTGESGALEESEYAQLLELAVNRVDQRMGVIAGVGAPATKKVISQAKLANALGVDALLAVTPYYSRPTQEGLYAHYVALANASHAPVILYNVPGRTGCDLMPETIARLALDANIVGVKEARAEAQRMDDLLAIKQAHTNPKSFSILSGDDPTAARAMIAGADGVISVAANICPALFKRLVELATRGQHDLAMQLDAAMSSLNRVLGVEPNPIPIKWLLAQENRIGADLRLPLLPLSPMHHASARDVLGLIDALEKQYEA
jgi:4-hydroxy-tetrahydrodipicolinate synthase